MRPISQILAEARALNRKATYPSEGLAAENGFLTRELREASEEIARFENKRVPREKGSLYFDFFLEDIPVLVEVDYEKGDPGRYTLSNGDPGYPPTPASVAVTRVWIAGWKIDSPEAVFSDWQMEKWSTQAEEAITEAEADRREE